MHVRDISILHSVHFYCKQDYDETDNGEILSVLVCFMFMFILSWAMCLIQKCMYVCMYICMYK